MMHRFLVRVPTVGALALLAACADGIPVAPLAPSTNGPTRDLGTAEPSTGRYLVGLEAGATLSPEALAASGGTIVDSIPAFGVLVVAGVTDPAALAQSGAAYVEPEFETTLETSRYSDAGAQAAPEALTSPWYASGVQWDMKAMSADQVWATTNAGEGATVCIVDTGVDDLHQELAGKVRLRANFVTSPASETGPGFLDDLDGHGSHVAGTVAARGTVMSGVAPRASVIAARVLNSTGSGSATAIVNGLRWCADNGAHVANLSLGGISYRGTASFVPTQTTYANAVKYATDRGVIVVSSAGNSNLRLPNVSNALLTLPAQVPGTIIVGATGPVSKVGAFTVGGTSRTLPLAVPGWNPFDPEQVWQGVDGKAFYSNYGTGVDVFAPGGRGGISLMYRYYRYNQQFQGSTLDQIYSLCSSKTTQTGAQNVGGAPGAAGNCAGVTSRYIGYAGTSMAAPHVAGLAALLYAEIGGEPTPEKRARVMACIQSTTDNIGPATTFGGGRVNARRAVDALRAGDC